MKSNNYFSVDKRLTSYYTSEQNHNRNIFVSMHVS